MRNSGPANLGSPAEDVELPTRLAIEADPPPVPGWDPPDDPHLIAATLAGDTEAFAALVRPCLPLFTIGIHRILQDGHDTQKALQEALLTIHSELRLFTGRSKFSAWAYRICLNEALILRRSRMRQRENRIEVLIPELPREGPLTVPEGSLAQVQESLSRFSSDQRTVFIMRDLEGMDTEDVARRLGISRTLVRQHLREVRNHLRDVPVRDVPVRDVPVRDVPVRDVPAIPFGDEALA